MYIMIMIHVTVVTFQEMCMYRVRTGLAVPGIRVGHRLSQGSSRFVGLVCKDAEREETSNKYLSILVRHLPSPANENHHLFKLEGSGRSQVLRIVIIAKSRFGQRI
jgi:hypothetical protein